MLLRYRRSGLDAIVGPCYEQNPPAGGPPAPPAPPTNPPPAPPAGGPPAPPAPPADDRSNWIPRDRFDSVNTEYQRLKKAEDERTEKAAKERGDFEALNAAEKAKTAEAEARAVRIARRAAFISKAASQVTDAEAAFKLAAADGMLDALDVDDDGNAKDPKAVDKIVADLLTKYEFLKGNDKGRSFGEPAGGNGAPPQDTSKMTPHEMLRAGYSTPPSRR